MRCPKITLKEVLEQSHASEEVKKHSNEFKVSEQNIDAINYSRTRRQPLNNYIPNCKYCGGSHQRRNC